MFAFNQAILWASVFALVSCRNDSQDVQRIHRAPQGPSSTQYGISVVYSDTSDFHWSLKALKLEEQRLDGTAQSEVFSGDVTAVQLLRSKPTGTRLRADRVVRNLKDQVWVLSGSVLVTKGSTKYLKTEFLATPSVGELSGRPRNGSLKTSEFSVMDARNANTKET